MKANLILALFSVATLGACIDQQDPSSADVSADPRLATNSLLPGSISASHLNAAPLTGTALSNSGLEDTADHVSFLRYMIECALGPKQTITSTYLAQTYTYTGNHNLAPAWTTRALTTSEMRYVSACVLSRANYFGTTVTISMRGETTLLATTLDESTNYNVEEAAFYGNMFDSRAGANHACNGVDQVRVGDTYGDLPVRQCGQPDPNNPGYTPCNYVFDGNCSVQCVRNGDHYSSCLDANRVSQTEVVTIRLYGTAP